MTEAERDAWARLTPDSLAAELALVAGDNDDRAVALREFAQLFAQAAK